MNYLTQIFKLNKLYDRRTVLSILIDAVYAFVAIFIFLGFILSAVRIDDAVSGGIVFLAIILCIIYFTQEIVHYFVVRHRIKSRDYIGFTVNINNDFRSQFIHSAVNQQLNFYDSVMYIKDTPQYTVFDSRYDKYRKTKNGQYKSGEAYYTVIEYKLPRQLPHLMFDSKTAKGRQFKLSFAGSQKLDLEGNFANYFDLYSPQYYQIDTLSFITPEVMEVMIQNSSCDIEIKGDSLMIFAPLLNNQQIEEFEASTRNLWQELSHNLKHYRDDRLDKLIGKEKVTDFGASLLGNPNKYLPPILITGLVVTAIIYYSLTLSIKILYNEFSIIVIIIFVSNLYGYFKLKNKNAKAEANFVENYQKPRQ